MLRDPVFWRTVAAGAVVSWPGIVVTVWLSHQRLKQQVKRDLNEVTRQQNGVIRDITRAQTETLLGQVPDSEHPM